MFGLGMGELVLIGLVLFIFIGPKKIPELAKGLGEGIGTLKKALVEHREE
jgi:sec-independent protein translocase protein TatA